MKGRCINLVAVNVSVSTGTVKTLYPMAILTGLEYWPRVTALKYGNEVKRCGKNEALSGESGRMDVVSCNMYKRP